LIFLLRRILCCDGPRLKALGESVTIQLERKVWPVRLQMMPRCGRQDHRLARFLGDDDGKATADEWIAVMRAAHGAGLRTTATMMYGTVETLEERIEHLLRIRELQDETGGFTAFITWSFQPDHTELASARQIDPATCVEYLRTLALARLVLDNVDNLQASWVTQGGKVGQLSLAYGANDMGSVMIEENVVRAAGAAYCMDEVEIVRNIENAGFVPKRRDMEYAVLGDPYFREQAVPRMTELATALSDHLPKVGTVYKRERAVGRLNSMIDLAEIVEDVSTRGVGIQRYKGLGEMNPTQLWETTLDPETRTLFKVEIEDAQQAAELFEMLMGEEVRPRANFIRTHAQEVQNLDV